MSLLGSITLPDGSRYVRDVPPVIRPNEAGWFRYQVLHDWQSGASEPAKTVRAVAPDPEVFRIGAKDEWKSHDKVPLNSEMQYFWAELLALKKFGERLIVLTREEREYINGRMDVVMGKAFALTNRGSPDFTRNYVAGTHTNEEVAKLAALLCGGNTVWGKPAGLNRDGEEMVEIYSLLEGETLPEPSLDDPRVQWLTAIYNATSVFPFTHLGDGVGVPYPLITAVRYYFPVSGLQAYSHDEPKRPMYVRQGAPSYQ